MSEVPHVALLIETSRTYGRRLLRGVRQYIAENGPWSVYLELRGLESGVPPWLKNWRGDGILTRTANQRMINAILATGAPAVELRATKLKSQFPFVGIDNRALGRIVAEHLLERGFRQFGIYELTTEDYFEQRRDNFIATLHEHGYECRVYRQEGTRERPSQWERQQDRLARWVADLPKPVGVMACTDQLGFWLLDACMRAGVAVPEELAVVGVENDESLCEMASPPMSSVVISGETVGYQAARLLQQMMRGANPPCKSLLIQPSGIHVRQSSDVVAVDEPVLSEALRYIREHACEGISVADVVAAISVSRSVLERGTRRFLGRTPNEEIQRIKLMRVRQLLAETDLTIEVIARESGFRHPQYLAELFKRHFKQTPGAFRGATERRMSGDSDLTK